ncbi:MAG: response regulator [Patescibacteria group bacterium]
MPDTPSKKPSLLLVDDDQFLLTMYALKFKNSGFDVEVVNSGFSALQKLRDGYTPRVVLCDLVMPSMDGLEFIKKMKEERLSPLSTVVVLTNQSQSAEIDRAKEIGVDGYIVKASTIPSEVVQKVRTILAKKTK